MQDTKVSAFYYKVSLGGNESARPSGFAIDHSNDPLNDWIQWCWYHGSGGTGGAHGTTAQGNVKGSGPFQNNAACTHNSQNAVGSIVNTGPITNTAECTGNSNDVSGSGPFTNTADCTGASSDPLMNSAGSTTEDGTFLEVIGIVNDVVSGAVEGTETVLEKLNTTVPVELKYIGPVTDGISILITANNINNPQCDFDKYMAGSDIIMCGIGIIPNPICVGVSLSWTYGIRPVLHDIYDYEMDWVKEMYNEKK
jgi:hypothetical protein